MLFNSVRFVYLCMESSMNSRSKPLSSSSNERTTSSNFEESGWTMYFEDFFAGNNDNDEYSSFSGVSDAASLVVKNPAEKERIVGLFSNEKSYGKLSLKKRRMNEALVDDALEDTASSPVNSPKVYDGMRGQFKNTKQKDHRNISQDEGHVQGQLQVEEKAKLGVIERENDSTELKKKGLCLVPLSMIVNFLG